MRRHAWLLVTVTIVIAALVGVFVHLKFQQRASRETVSKKDLRTMRKAIDNYTMDKREPLQSLEDLVPANYLREIPIDPVCQRMHWNGTPYGSW